MGKGSLKYSMMVKISWSPPLTSRKFHGPFRIHEQISQPLLHFHAILMSIFQVEYPKTFSLPSSPMNLKHFWVLQNILYTPYFNPPSPLPDHNCWQPTYKINMSLYGSPNNFSNSILNTKIDIIQERECEPCLVYEQMWKGITRYIVCF